MDKVEAQALQYVMVCSLLQFKRIAQIKLRLWWVQWQDEMSVAKTEG